MTITIPYEYDKNNCFNRLPCGVCRITMTMCPLKPVDPKTTITYTTGTANLYVKTLEKKENEID